MRYEYDSFGHLARVKHNVTNGVIYWEATDTDAAGRILHEVFGKRGHDR